MQIYDVSFVAFHVIVKIEYMTFFYNPGFINPQEKA